MLKSRCAPLACSLLLCILVSLAPWACRVGQLCERDEDCPIQQPRCLNNSCYACRQDSDCLPTQRCLQNTCAAPQTNGERPTSSEGPTDITAPKDAGTNSERPTEPTTADLTRVEGLGSDLGSEPYSDGTPSDATTLDEGGNVCQDKQTRPCYTGPPKSAGLGLCKAGTKRCVLGRWEKACRGQTLPTQEICDGLDNDCNGKVDEICGPSLSYARILKDGKIKAHRALTQISYNSTIPGQYTLSFANLKCSQTPLLLNLESEEIGQITYKCDKDLYKVTTGVLVKTSKGWKRYQRDFAFLAVAVQRGVWGRLIKSSSPFNPNCSLVFRRCKLDQSSIKDLTLTHKSKGIYSFQHPACQPKRPFFATLAEDSTIGSVAATITKAGTCSIKTYSSEGKLFDKSFSFWLPDHNKLVWAQLDVAGNIIAKQDFNAPKGRWKSVVRRGIPEFSFVGWRKDHSAFLFNPSSGFGVPGFRESPNNSAYLYLHHPQQKVRVTQPLQILFVP